MAHREELPDVQARPSGRPIYHHKRESIDAHLATVFAALAVTHWIENQTGWSIKKFVRTARRYRTVKIEAGNQILTAAGPLPADLSEALARIANRLEHQNEPRRVKEIAAVDMAPSWQGGLRHVRVAE